QRAPMTSLPTHLLLSLALTSPAAFGQKAAAQPAALSFAGEKVAVAGGQRGAVEVLSLAKGEVQWTRKLLPLTAGERTTPLAEGSSLACSPDGKTLAVGGGVLYHGHVAALDAATGKLLWVSRDVGPQQQVSLAFSPDGKSVCAGSLGGAARLLDAGS